MKENKIIEIKKLKKKWMRKDIENDEIRNIELKIKRKYEIRIKKLKRKWEIRKYYNKLNWKKNRLNYFKWKKEKWMKLYNNK